MNFREMSKIWSKRSTTAKLMSYSDANPRKLIPANINSHENLFPRKLIPLRYSDTLLFYKQRKIRLEKNKKRNFLKIGYFVEIERCSYKNGLIHGCS